MSINKVILCGNVSRDPELRNTAGGTPVLDFGIAVNDRVKGEGGEYEDYANFFNCTMFGSRAERLSEIVKKGMKITVEGRLHFSQWEDKQTGKKKSAVTVNVSEIELPNKSKAEAPNPYDADIPF